LKNIRFLRPQAKLSNFTSVVSFLPSRYTYHTPAYKNVNMEAYNGYSVSQAHISRDVDRAMDEADAKFNHVPPGVAVRNGTVVEDQMEVDEPATNGNTKRKARTSTSKAPKYADSESDEDSVPLVGIFPGFRVTLLPDFFSTSASN
jgi:hypothetical protein